VSEKRVRATGNNAAGQEIKLTTREIDTNGRSSAIRRRRNAGVAGEQNHVPICGTDGPMVFPGYSGLRDGLRNGRRNSDPDMVLDLPLSASGRWPGSPWTVPSSSPGRCGSGSSSVPGRLVPRTDAPAHRPRPPARARPSPRRRTAERKRARLG